MTEKWTASLPVFVLYRAVCGVTLWNYVWMMDNGAAGDKGRGPGGSTCYYSFMEDLTN
jgi:hypothetical protein